MPVTSKTTQSTETRNLSDAVPKTSNLPTGWVLVDYPNQPGGGARCPNCGTVEDLGDVGGHRC